MKFVDGIVGNSSSGIIEAPSFGVGTIDIGSRQHGRLRATSVIHCDPTREKIANALQRLFSDEFQDSLAQTINPYGDGGASARIVEIIAKEPLDGLLRKSFFDLPDNHVSTRL
jgi:GDP/UDP-N,N'-diacetylbacillosamine 2-epimerase (hydrolysing)